MRSKISCIVALLAVIMVMIPPAANAQEAEEGAELSPDEIVCNLDVIVQRDDWLSKLADKFYGDVLAYPAIFEATNLKAAQDPTYAVIEDEDLIEPGWKLCIVGLETAQAILGFELENAPLVDTTPVNLTGAINVGAAHALSGPYAAIGQSIRNGIDLAAQEINNGIFLGGGIIQIIWEDTAGDKEQARAVFNKLINDDRVVAILGPTLSRSAFAAVPLAQAAGIPVIGSSNTADGVTDIGDFVFRTNLPESAIISNTVQQAKTAFDLQSVVMLQDVSNPFTQSSHQTFEQALQAQQIEILATYNLVGGAADFSTQLAEIQTLQPDAVILNLLPAEAVEFIRQARQLGLPEDIRFIAGDSVNTPAFFALGGETVNGTIVGVAWNVNENSGNNRKFVNDYQAAYGAAPNQLAAQGYSAVWALAIALRSADSTDPAVIREALDAIDLIDSPMGLFTFNDDRMPDHLPVVQIAQDGSFVLLP